MAPTEEPTLDPTFPIPDGSMERDDVYYLKNVVFRVENTLFRVPRRGFELDSTIFRSMFSLPTGQHNPEGLDDNSPIVLQGVNKKDFRSLLEMMYPMGPKLPSLAHEDLVAVLHLSTMWELAKIRECVIKIMDDAPSPMDPVERIILGKKERISTWLRRGYGALVEEECLTMDRVKIFDWETIAKLFYIRDNLPASVRRESHPESIHPDFGGMEAPYGGAMFIQAPYPGQWGTLVHEVLKPPELGSPRPKTPELPRAKVLLEETFQQELFLIQEEEYEKGWKD